MKNYFKILLASALLAVNSYGASSTFLTNVVAGVAMPTNTMISLLTSGPLLINSISVINTSGQTTNVLLNFIDGPGTLGVGTNYIVYTNSGFTNRALTTNYNDIVVFTNFSGVVQVVTNTAVSTALTTNTARTGLYKTVVSIVTSNGQTFTYTPPSPLIVSYGLGITSTNTILTNTIVTVNYSTILP